MYVSEELRLIPSRQVARALREVTELEEVMELCRWNQPSFQPTAMVNGLGTYYYVTS